VWVGYDDYSDIRLSGAMTAAPIWTEFMKKASALPQYSDMHEFEQPAGVVDVSIDKTTNRLATPTCPDDYTSAFIAGTEPQVTCDQQEGIKGFFSRLFGGQEKVLPPSPNPPNANSQGPAIVEDKDGKKKGLFGKIAGIFKDDKDDKQQVPVSKPPNNAPPAPPPH
jgi:penicillin-binding protein 1B